MLRLSRHARWIEFPAPVRAQGKTENRSFWAPNFELRIIKNECGFSTPHVPYALFSSLDVRFAPESGQIADMSACPLSANNDRMQRSKKAVLFDRFVGPHKQCWRDTETECLRVFAQVSTAKPRHGRPMAGFLRSVRGGSLHPSHAIQMSRLATTSTIPVMSTAKQENSRRSLRSICILPPPLTSHVLGHLDTPRYCPWFAIRLRNHHESFHACSARGLSGHILCGDHRRHRFDRPESGVAGSARVKRPLS